MQGLRPWDSESVSSQTSDATSRATTVYSSSEASVSTQGKADRSNIPLNESNRSSSPTTTTASVNTVISRNSGAQGINRNQQPWVNPYWGPSSKSNTTGTNANTVNRE